MERSSRQDNACFETRMPNRMFIINRLSGMAYEGLSDSSAAAGQESPAPSFHDVLA